MAGSFGRQLRLREMLEVMATVGKYIHSLLSSIILLHGVCLSDLYKPVIRNRKTTIPQRKVGVVPHLGLWHFCVIMFTVLLL